jgi:hypothetical protein
MSSFFVSYVIIFFGNSNVFKNDFIDFQKSFFEKVFLKKFF